jgi:teichuronic acid biosynthesis glycosyltransferase TuaH
MVCLPPGYAGRLEPYFRPYLRSVVASECARLRRTTGAEPIVFCPYPYLAPWVRGISDQNVVYYNLDDYALYDPARAERTARLEDEIIARARLSLCLSVHQVEALRARHPRAVDRIKHFPLGVVEEFLNPEPDLPPLPQTVGYVGNLTNRVDWTFVERVARLVPDAKFHIVGKLDCASSGPKVDQWRAARTRVLELANVVYEGAVPQTKVREHYWRYAVNWMPYAIDHPFNLASCPTKIMDALASGRGFVATDIHEVRLYRDHIRIARTPEEAAENLQQILINTPTHQIIKQIAFAAGHTWAARAQELMSWTENIWREQKCRMDRANVIP